MQLFRERFNPGTPSVLWMLIVTSALLTSALRAEASERSVSVQPDVGVRFFNSDVGLESSASVGIRMDLGVLDRLSFGIDYVLSTPNRKNSGRLAAVDALRALVRFDLMGGSTRPFVEAGIGGLSFNFTDAVDFATSAGTLGVGVSHRLGRHHVITVEGTGDLYQTRVENYDVTGRLQSIGPARWNRLANISAGIGYRF